MNLKDFIKATIRDITEAVDDINADASLNQYAIIGKTSPDRLPALNPTNENATLTFFEHESIQFDVALTASLESSNGQEGRGGLRVQVGGLVDANLGGSLTGATTRAAERESRVLFNLTVSRSVEFAPKRKPGVEEQGVASVTTAD